MEFYFHFCLQTILTEFCRLCSPLPCSEWCSVNAIIGPHVLDPEVYSRAGEMQGYALHGHMDLHTWHTYVGSTGTLAQYILPVPWSWDYLLLGTMSLG